MKLQAALILACLLFFPVRGVASEDGNKLLKYCQSAISLTKGKWTSATASEESMACSSYIGGMMDMNTLYRWLLEDLKSGVTPFFCLPQPPITRGQAVRIVTKYLQEHPEELHEEAAILTMKAVQKAFPCRN